MTDHPTVEHGPGKGTYSYRGWAIVQCRSGPVDVDGPHTVCPIGRSMRDLVTLPSLADAAAYINRVHDRPDFHRPAQSTDPRRAEEDPDGVRDAS